MYINNGFGKFEKSSISNKLSNTKGIAFSDYDKDGDIDIFVGSKVKYGQYPITDKPYFLENNNGKFNNVIDTKFDDVSNLKIINDVVFSDFDNDGDDDLIVVGEWMSITFFENKNNKFYKKGITGITGFNGWFQSIKASDLDNDGNTDYIIGNWGKTINFTLQKKNLYIFMQIILMIIRALILP